MHDRGYTPARRPSGPARHLSPREVEVIVREVSLGVIVFLAVLAAIASAVS